MILLVTYCGVATALVAWRGIDGAQNFDDNEAILGAYADQALGDPLGSLVLLAVVVSALASTQTTILPASRTSLSMARAEAMPAALGRGQLPLLHPGRLDDRDRRPGDLWYVPSKLISENFLFDSLSALALMIAFYYALTGFACAIYYRRELTKSVRNLLFIGVAPVVGATLLGYLFFKALVDYSDPANSYTGSSWFGIAPPAVIGVGFILLGFVLLFAWRRHQREPFFLRRREVADPRVLDGDSGTAACDRGRRRVGERYDRRRRAALGQQAVRRAASRSTISASRSPRASSSPCSAPAAAARRRRCGWSPASRSRATARC